MWPFPNRSLFPPPTQAWLQTVSSDPEAQGWGARNETKEIVGPEGGEEKQEEDEAEEDQDGDAGFLLSLLEQENLAECPVPDQAAPSLGPRRRRWRLTTDPSTWATWTTGAPPRSWRPTSAAVGRSTESPSCATSSLDTPRGQCGAWWGHWPCGQGPASPLPSLPCPSPQLCLHRVCHQGLRAGRRGAGPEPLPGPAHQGTAEKNQLPWDQLHRPRGPSRTPRLQGGTLPPQRPPGPAPAQTTRAESGPWKILTMVFTVLKGRPDFVRGAGGWGLGQE
ncbi:embryonic polyadenylate-binding protein 2 isoform X2 [Hylobates moloch]|uniref:embryonic polyadenylate-binding protein 2 isoform X2 n=1 Tax=Hylobates moloch TaxID=81572 RepID=UPI00267610C5|nr:embryonic polyadenylate-binding protein 2 isoform X2 [Hylobates moloch]